MLATKKDIEKINKNIETIDRQIYEIQKKVYGINPNLVKQNVEQFLNEEDVKYCKLSINNLYTQLTATNEDVKKHYEETKNAIINLQKQITEIHKKVDWNKTLDDYYNIKMDNIGKPNWVTDYSPTHSLEVIIDSQKATIIKMQNEEKKYLKKIQELEYANRTLQDENEKVKKDRIIVKSITYDGVDIDHLQFRIKQAESQISNLDQQNQKLKKENADLETTVCKYHNEIEKLQNENNKLNGINHSIGYRNAQLRINYDKKFEELEFKIKVLEIQKDDLKRRISNE